MNPPPIRRIAATVPPAAWFHGIAGDLAAMYRQGLLDLGIEVFDVPVDAFFPPDPPRIARLVDDLRAFAPELAIGLTHGSYALICRMPGEADGHRSNLFLDVLDLPTICLWDHAPMELADQVLGALPAAPEASQAGALAALRRTLCHPRLIHWSRDRGQTRIMESLGLVAPGRTIYATVPVLPPFLRPPAAPPGAGAGFVGHVYQGDHPSRGTVPDALGRLAYSGWMAGRAPSLWDAFAWYAGLLPDAIRQRSRLDADQTWFWSFAHRFILHEAQTIARLAALGAAGIEVACIGNLDAGAPSVPRNLVAAGGRVGFRDGLAEALQRSAVTIDVLNPGFVEGYSHKPLLGFAAGGFMLVNRVASWVENFGDAGLASSWTDHDDLAAKLDRYLTRPTLREEIGAAIRAEIRERHSMPSVLTRVLVAARALA